MSHTEKEREDRHRHKKRENTRVSAQRLNLIKDALSGEVDTILGVVCNTLHSVQYNRIHSVLMDSIIAPQTVTTESHLS